MVSSVTQKPMLSALQPLRPVTMVPEWGSLDRQDALEALKRVGYFRVTSKTLDDGREGFEVGVFLRSRKLQLQESHIPSTWKHSLIDKDKDEDASQIPDFRVWKTKKAFKSLQKQLSYDVHVSHRYTYCYFCSNVGEFIQYIGSSSKVEEGFYTDFLNAVVEFTLRWAEHEHNACNAMRNIPRTLYDFIRAGDV